MVVRGCGRAFPGNRKRDWCLPGNEGKGVSRSRGSLSQGRGVVLCSRAAWRVATAAWVRKWEAYQGSDSAGIRMFAFGHLGCLVSSKTHTGLPLGEGCGGSRLTRTTLQLGCIGLELCHHSLLLGLWAAFVLPVFLG